MKRYIHVVVFLLLAIASIFMFTMLILDYLAISKGQQFDMLFTKVSNPFLLVIVFVLPIFYAFTYMVFTAYSEDTFIDNKQEEVQTKSTQEIIEEEIQNKYLDRIDTIQKNIVTKSETETELSKKAEKALWAFCSELSLSQGLLYKKVESGKAAVFQLLSTYAYIGEVEKINRFEVGVGVNGQVAYSGEPVFIDQVPKDYLKIISGLGESHPNLLLIVPIKNASNEVLALLEVSGFGTLNTKEVQTIYQISQTAFSNILK